MHALMTIPYIGINCDRNNFEVELREYFVKMSKAGIKKKREETEFRINGIEWLAQTVVIV